MKAKEFADQYLNADDKTEEYARILKTFLSDFLEMMKIRKAVTNPAIISLLKEFENKWKTFVKLVKEKSPETIIEDSDFRGLIDLLVPQIKGYW